MTENRITTLLAGLGLVEPARLEPYGVCRDRPDIAVLRCPTSGVVLLSRSDHMDISHYTAKQGDDNLIAMANGASERVVHLDKAGMRAAAFGDYVLGRDWLDFGTGEAHILDMLAPRARSAAGVEPNAAQRAWASSRGHTIHATIDDLGETRYDVITLFHVLEHLPDPVGMLLRLRNHLTPGGRLLIEVPHARDALLTLYDCEPFRRFTLWSEHLVLHTRDSLRAVLAAAGFGAVVVHGLQRYPLANHLHWLARSKPGGHQVWHFLSNAGLAGGYEAALQSLDATDTLVALAS